MFLIRFVVNVLLFMFALPALGLVTFTGGLGTGFLAALLSIVFGVVAIIGLLPLLATFGTLGALLSGAVGGRLGLVTFNFVLSTLVYAVAIGLVAWVLPGLALLGFWPTMGAAAVLGLVGAVLTPASKS